MFYIDQLCTSSFPIVLVKTELAVQTGSTVDAYPSLFFSDQTCHLKDTGIGVF